RADADVGEAAPRTQQCLVNVTHVGQVRSEQDLASLRADDAVGDRKKPVQVQIAVRWGVEYVIRVFDHESVMTPGSELDEDFVALERTRVGCVKYIGAVTLAPGNCCQHRAHEPGLPGPGWPLKNENRFGCRLLHEPIDQPRVRGGRW